MRTRALIFVLPAFWILSGREARAERIPVEDFAHFAAFSSMTLSPDGRTVAYVQNLKGLQEIVLRDLDQEKPIRLEMPASRVPWVPQATRIAWLNSQRLIFSLAEGGFSAVDRDGQRLRGLTGSYRDRNLSDDTEIQSTGLIHFFRGSDEESVLMTEYPSREAQYQGEWRVLNAPNVIRMHTRTGAWSRVEKNPGTIELWIPDSAGTLRVALEVKGSIARTVYRKDAQSPWAPLPGMDWNDPMLRPLALSSDDRTLYVNRKTPKGHWAVYPYDLAEHSFGEPVIAHEHFDIVPNDWRSVANGILVQGLVIARDRSRELLGAHFLTEFPRTVWFDPGLDQAQAALNSALPGRINTIISLSDNRQRLLVQSWSSADPGTYYLFDTEAKTLAKLLARMPWIDPAKMAESSAVRLRARDGTLLQAYLTLPPGRGGKNLPLVALVHGGPHTRDVWGYDPDVQFLANRGYAVLQVNYRGSVGFGDAFQKMARREVGGKVQHDITDGVRWAVQQGIADGRRLAIMGVSFGGYSALMGLALEPELYRCGINISGVTDWIELIKDKAEMFPRSFGFNVTLVGDPVKDADLLRSISPVHLVDRMRAPVLIIHGRDDPAVPFPQARGLVNALEKAGKPHEFMSKYNEQHGLLDFRNRVEMYQRIDAFLAKHLPADGGTPKSEK
ncbi:MAG: S9 family peptidase [Opitutaceae bacterium]|nr:S9 family peptidase [Opitutaceae bacterium]